MVFSADMDRFVAVDFTRFVSVSVIAFDTEGKAVRDGEVFVDGEPVPEGVGVPKLVNVRVGLRRIEVRADGYVIDGAAPVINFEQDLTEPLLITLRKTDQ